MEQLTIGMAVYEDFDGVYFSIQSLRYYHQDAPLSRLKFLVIDNCPGGKHSEHIKKFVTKSVGGTYIATDKVKGTAVRDLIFQEAKTELVLCMDSHVLVEPGAVKRLLAFYDQNPNTQDLLQGPLVYDDIYNMATHFNPEWRGGMYGTWGFDERARNKMGDPFEIPAQGLGLFTCRKSAWQGFNPRFSGFGGEEFYIHEKFRQAGHKALCLPFLRWIHRFGRPNGTIYPNKWEDRIRNYLIGWRELGLETQELEAHFATLTSVKIVEAVKASVLNEELEMNGHKAA
jgi:hypothetical protein